MAIEDRFTEPFTRLLTQISNDSETYDVVQSFLEGLEGCFQQIRENNPEEFQEVIFSLEQPPWPLYERLGKIVREFYEQFKALNLDIPKQLGVMATHDLEDAEKRLAHIIEMTEKSANKTMDLTEALLDQLSEKATMYNPVLSSIDKALETPGLPEEVSESLKNARLFIQHQQEEDEGNQSTLTDILIAQDYQDLTGQLIQKTMALLKSLEGQLLTLIETFGTMYVAMEAEVSQEEVSQELLEGPQTYKESHATQDSVDQLLDSLGF